MASGLRWTEEAFRDAQKRGPKALADLVAPAILPAAFRVKASPIVHCAITLPFPPTLNHMHVNVHKGRIRSKAYVAFCGLVEHIVARENVPKFGAQRLAVTISLHWPNKRKGDLDNRAKAVLDSLQRAGVYDDDECIDRLTLLRGEIVKGGLCVVTIEVLT